LLQSRAHFAGVAGILLEAVLILLCGMLGGVAAAMLADRRDRGNRTAAPRAPENPTHSPEQPVSHQKGSLSSVTFSREPAADESEAALRRQAAAARALERALDKLPPEQAEAPWIEPSDDPPALPSTEKDEWSFLYSARVPSPAQHEAAPVPAPFPETFSAPLPGEPAWVEMEESSRPLLRFDLADRWEVPRPSAGEWLGSAEPIAPVAPAMWSVADEWLPSDGSALRAPQVAFTPAPLPRRRAGAEVLPFPVEAVSAPPPSPHGPGTGGFAPEPAAVDSSTWPVSAAPRTAQSRPEATPVPPAATEAATIAAPEQELPSQEAPPSAVRFAVVEPEPPRNAPQGIDPTPAEEPPWKPAEPAKAHQVAAPPASAELSSPEGLPTAAEPAQAEISWARLATLYADAPPTQSRERLSESIPPPPAPLPVPSAAPASTPTGASTPTSAGPTEPPKPADGDFAASSTRLGSLRSPVFNTRLKALQRRLPTHFAAPLSPRSSSALPSEPLPPPRRTAEAEAFPLRAPEAEPAPNPQHASSPAVGSVLPNPLTAPPAAAPAPRPEVPLPRPRIESAASPEPPPTPPPDRAEPPWEDADDDLQTLPSQRGQYRRS
jgi:hypothetical protein